MVNSISWGNSMTDTATYSYSCGPGFSGNNSIPADPRFINAAKGDYRLRGSSPCIDAGLNQAWMSGAIDLDGHDRIAPGTGRVDIGAYEYTPFRTLMIVR